MPTGSQERTHLLDVAVSPADRVGKGVPLASIHVQAAGSAFVCGIVATVERQ